MHPQTNQPTQQPVIPPLQAEERPWGSYAVLGQGDCFKTKLLRVRPGHSLSLQFHHQRDEHWVVVQGKGLAVNGSSTVALEPNVHLHIPAKAEHRLENDGSEEDLLIVEVQLGAYLGEDDIVRLSDRYGRQA